MPHLEDYATGKRVRTGPEEQVRQEYERILVDDYGYERGNIDIEVPIPRGSGRRSDRADVVVYRRGGRDPAVDILGIVEVKKPGVVEGKDQLKSYMTATSAVWGVWTNGETIEYFCKPEGESSVYSDRINNIPAQGQRIEDIGKLAKETLKPYGRMELKLAFRHILNTLYANTNISRREKLGNEAIKLIFSKIRDETTYLRRPPAFRVGFDENPEDVKSRVEGLFSSVITDLADDGVFESHEKITLDARGVAWVVGQIQHGSLINTPTDVVGDAFEVFAESKFVGEKGEFFTPRNVIDVAVKLVNPRPNETVCDPACGSGGFIITAMRHVWDAMNDDPQWKGMPEKRLDAAKKHIAERCFFGIDKESDLVRIAKAYMAISGDGRSNIVWENALHSPAEFNPTAASKFALTEGGLRQFDCILTNPPYGTSAKVLVGESAQYELGHKWTRAKDDSWLRGAPRETDPYVLFIERCFAMLRAGGRMAIVLPETVFHAPSTERLRDYIAEHGDVVAVVSLPHNTFRPHCNAKTCMLIVAKRTGERATRSDVVMASPHEMGHNHQGKPIYRPGTNQLWDDMPRVLSELDNPDDSSNEFVFTVPWSSIADAGHLIPHYYAYQRRWPRRAPSGRRWVRLGDLVDDGSIKAHDGHGSPTSAEKGQGDIPYVRVADIVNWELYRNPTSGLTEEAYERLMQGQEAVEPHDVIFVRRGSYRIGTVAMASERDRKVLLTRELLTLRVVAGNRYRIKPYYLLAMLSTGDVQAQIDSLVFVDTTLPNIGDRWRELRLPIHRSVTDMEALNKRVRSIVTKKWQAQSEIETIRETLGSVVT